MPAWAPLRRKSTRKSSTVKLNGFRSSAPNIEPGRKSSYWLSELEKLCPDTTITPPL